MKHLLIASALAIAASPAIAGGGSGNHTSYSQPIVHTVYEPGVVVYLGGYQAPSCSCDCSSNLQLAMNVATQQVVITEGSTRQFYVWSN